MKTIIIIAVVTVFMAGCEQSTSSSDKLLTAAFTLTDLNGEKFSQLHSGEEFKLEFTLINTTDETLTFYRGSSAPPVTFEITKNDRVIASSVDGYTFLTVVLGGTVAPGDSLRGSWQAPTTPPQNPKIVLSPGAYEAKVLFPDFRQIKVNPVSSIKFSVIQ